MIEAVLFDWGDTVMRVFPRYAGPMATWPQVEAMPDAVEVLLSLRPRYRLALATNSLDSDKPAVNEALKRVGLGDAFDAIYTAAQLMVSKPQVEFFLAVVADLGLRPEQAVMVGDSYQVDVMGAHRAGLRTVWLNARARKAPLPAVHDAEIRGLAALPGALARLGQSGSDQPLFRGLREDARLGDD